MNWIEASVLAWILGCSEHRPFVRGDQFHAEVEIENALMAFNYWHTPLNDYHF